MLYLSTVEKPAWQLLKQLMNDNRLNDFFLVGGTALALNLGHRLSIDIDLFSHNGFDTEDLSGYLIKQYKFSIDYSAHNTLKGFVNNIKLDFITHSYPLIEKVFVADGIRMWSLQDIAAMKLNAIHGNGSRIKDFIDIAFLSEKFSLSRMLSFFEKKYPGVNPVSVVKALNYFEDINHNEKVMLLNAKFDWKIIGKRITQMTASSNKIFDKLLFKQDNKAKGFEMGD